jgi:uncharacterized membrane protein
MSQSSVSPLPEKNAALILRVTALCWLMAKLIGWRMFTTYRVFPTAPVMNLFDNVPSPVHTFLFILSVLLLLLLLAAPLNKVFLLCLLLCEVFSSLLDQNRLQPWDYQYMFILFIYLVNDLKTGKATAAFLVILASTYVYGGLGKLNTGFLHTIWTKMLLEQFLHVPSKSALLPWVQSMGYLAGFFELTAGLCLLFNKTRKISAGALIVMHLFILVFLGPLGLRYNIVVWPWNIAMIVYLYLAGFKTEKDNALTWQVFRGWNLPVLICWAILPAFNFVGWWDNYLSSGVYSGKLPGMVICIRDTSKCKPLQRYCMKDYRGVCSGGEVVNLQYWSMAETKMAPYPEIRSYKKIQAKLEKEFPGAGLSFIYSEGKSLK